MFSISTPTIATTNSTSMIRVSFTDGCWPYLFCCFAMLPVPSLSITGERELQLEICDFKCFGLSIFSRLFPFIYGGSHHSQTHTHTYTFRSFRFGHTSRCFCCCFLPCLSFGHVLILMHTRKIVACATFLPYQCDHRAKILLLVAFTGVDLRQCKCRCVFASYFPSKNIICQPQFVSLYSRNFGPVFHQGLSGYIDHISKNVTNRKQRKRLEKFKQKKRIDDENEKKNILDYLRYCRSEIVCDRII